MSNEQANVENTSAVKILALMAKSRYHLRAMSFTLRGMPEVKSSNYSVNVDLGNFDNRNYFDITIDDNVIKYHGRYGFNLNVSAELYSGSALDWDIEVTFSKGTWSIESSVSIIRNVPRSQVETLFEFEERYAATLDDCVQAVEHALVEIEDWLAIVPKVEANLKTYTSDQDIARLLE